MAYRKTDKVREQIAAKREAILDAAEAIMAGKGIDALTTASLTARAKISIGGLYHQYPDLDGVIAGVGARALARVVEPMRAVADSARRGEETMAGAMMVLYGQLDKPRLARALLSIPLFARGIRQELAGMIRDFGSITPRESEFRAAAILGATVEILATFGPELPNAKRAARVALMICGVSERMALEYL